MGKYHLKEAEVRMYVREKEGVYSVDPILCSEDALKLIREEMAGLDRENVWAVCMDVKGKPISYSVVSIGAIDCSVFTMATVFRSAILQNAARILVAHNHPSEDPTPSELDMKATKDMIEAGKLLGIPVVDHIIVGGKDRCYRFRESEPNLFE